MKNLFVVALMMIFSIAMAAPAAALTLDTAVQYEQMDNDPKDGDTKDPKDKKECAKKCDKADKAKCDKADKAKCDKADAAAKKSSCCAKK